MPQNTSLVDCITPRLDCEDIGSLIIFIDHFLPMLDRSDSDSVDTGNNVFRVRQKLHTALILANLGEDIPEGVDPRV